MNTPYISVVSPVYKAETIVDTLVERTISAIEKITPNFEIILVDDCSPDNSWEKIVKNCNKYSFVKGVKLSRNFGQQHATQAGLNASSGDYIVTMDCDLQDQPEEIIKLYNKALEGYDIVLASRVDRKDSLLKKTLSYSFYKVLGYLTETEQDSSIANFIFYNRKSLDAINELQDHIRYYPMLIQWVGFKRAKVEIEHANRIEGNTSYNFRKRLQLGIDTILTFSDKPLRLSVKFGVFISLIAIFITLLLVGLFFFEGVEVAGWTSSMVLLTFFSGVIISVLGMVGLYVGRIFEAVKYRPTYIVYKSLNF